MLLPLQRVLYLMLQQGGASECGALGVKLSLLYHWLSEISDCDFFYFRFAADAVSTACTMKGGETHPLPASPQAAVRYPAVLHLPSPACQPG